MSGTKVVQCAFCGRNFLGKGIYSHLKSKHNKTTRDNQLALHGWSEETLPKCKYCDKPILVDVDVHEICGSEECRKKQWSERMSKSGKIAQQKLLALGTHPCLKKNRRIDPETGKDWIIMQAIRSGKNPLLHKNLKFDENGKSISHKKLHESAMRSGKFNLLTKNRTDENGVDLYNKKAIESGRHPLIKQNRPKTEWGKDLYSTLSRGTQLNKDFMQSKLYDKDYLIGHYVKDDKFQFRQIMEDFDVSATFVRDLKIQLGINIPGDEHGLQNEVYKFVKKILEESKDNSEVIPDDRQLICPRELDVYIPNKRLAIEFDGLYYHSLRPDDYHLQKSVACHQQNVNLLHVFEYEWTRPEKRQIWESIIRHKLGYTKRKISARKCALSKDNHSMKAFIQQNCLNGDPNFDFSYSLVYNNELVAGITFKNTEAGFELLNFCTKINTAVFGAATRLYMEFRKDNRNGTVTTIADRRWYTDNIYDILGFNKTGETPPQRYFFRVHGEQILVRERDCNETIARQLINTEDYDSNATFLENLIKNNVPEVFDAGAIIYQQRN